MKMEWAVATDEVLKSVVDWVFTLVLASLWRKAVESCVACESLILVCGFADVPGTRCLLSA